MNRLRTSLSLVLALSLALGSVTPAFALDEPMVGEEEFAVAFWVFPKKKPGHFTGYLAFVVDSEPVAGKVAYRDAMVGSGPCRKKGGEGICTMTRGGGVTLRPGEFEIDPLLQSASLLIQRDRFDVDITWTAEGSPLPGRSFGAGGGDDYEFETQAVHVGRMASMDGSVFGRRLGAEGLQEGARFSQGPYTGQSRPYERSLEIGGFQWRLPSP